VRSGPALATVVESARRRGATSVVITLDSASPAVNHAAGAARPGSAVRSAGGTEVLTVGVAKTSAGLQLQVTERQRSETLRLPFGVRVRGMRVGGAAALSGQLRLDDVITHVDGRPLRSAADFASRVQHKLPDVPLQLTLERAPAPLPPSGPPPAASALSLQDRHAPGGSSSGAAGGGRSSSGAGAFSSSAMSLSVALPRRLEGGVLGLGDLATDDAGRVVVLRADDRALASQALLPPRAPSGDPTSAPPSPLPSIDGGGGVDPAAASAAVAEPASPLSAEEEAELQAMVAAGDCVRGGTGVRPSGELIPMCR
jgi:hypothetical protein